MWLAGLHTKRSFYKLRHENRASDLHQTGVDVVSTSQSFSKPLGGEGGWNIDLYLSLFV